MSSVQDIPRTVASAMTRGGLSRATAIMTPPPAVTRVLDSGPPGQNEATNIRASLIAQGIEIECGRCGVLHQKTLGWLRTAEAITCACGESTLAADILRGMDPRPVLAAK